MSETSRARQSRSNSQTSHALKSANAPKNVSRDSERRHMSPGPMASVTEQILIAKERLLANVYQRLKQAKASNNKEDVRNFSEVIESNERTWKRMWKAPYVPSKRTPVPGASALSIQIDKLQAVVSRRIGTHLDNLDREKIDPLNRKIKTYDKLIAELKQDQKKVGFLEGKFLGDKLDKDIARIESIVNPIKKERDKYVQKRRLLINDYMDFVSYLEEGRETIGQLSRIVPNSNKIKMTPRPVLNVGSAFSALDEMFVDFRSEVIDLHKNQSVKPAQHKAKLTKDTVKSIEEEFNKLNFLGKFFAGDIGKDARGTAKEASVEYAIALQNHQNVIQKFNTYADTIKAASTSFEKGQPISFTLTTNLQNESDPTTRVRVVKSEVKVNFSDSSIILRLGLDPKISEVGEFTRRNEGTDKTERKIHFPGFNSGITIAGGYDVGHKSKATVISDLNYVNKALRLTGKDEIPDSICKQLIGAVGLTRDRARLYLREHPDLRNYRLPKEAVDVFFYKYYKREYQTAERVVNKNIRPYKFEDLPLEVRQLIADTVTRGDFKSLRNREKRNKFYGAIKDGIKTDNWDKFAEIYTDRTIFTLNPTINRHTQRAEKAEELKST
jgi:hypothetical protein